MANQNQLDKLSNPAHLALSDTDQLKAAAEKAVTPEAKPTVDPDDPKLRDTYPFDFDWTDPRGRRWMGKFTNKILSIAQQQAAAVLRAQLGGGMSVVSLDVEAREVNLMIAHMEFSLIDRPDWAKDLRSLKDKRLLYRLYEEVAAHEGTFFGHDESEGGSAAAV